MDQLTKEQFAAYQKAFKMFDEDGDGTIPTKKLKPVLVKLGFNKSEKKLKELLKGVNAYGHDDLEFSKFLKIMVQVLEDMDGDDEDD